MKSIISKNLRNLNCSGLLAGIVLATATHGYSAVASPSFSSIVTVSESPNSFTSSLSGASTYDFNSLPTGQSKNVTWNGVGTFDQLYIIPANQYGGAPSATQPKGSNYSVQGIGSPVSKTTLTLNTPSSYFGFYWSAGDASNQLSFYKGNTLVGSFTTQSLMKNLPSDYYGNPLNRAQNKGEPYAFINFYGDQSTSWDKIVLNNTSSSGFESDNYTSRTQAWTVQADGAITGKPIQVVSVQNGKNIVTAVTADTVKKLAPQWSFSSKAPAAPAPPILALVAFAAVAGIRDLRNRKGERKSSSTRVASMKKDTLV